MITSSLWNKVINRISFIRTGENTICKAHCVDCNMCIGNLKLLWRLNTIKLSWATCHVRWINSEQTNILRTISIFITIGSDDSWNTGLFAIFLRRTMEIPSNTLVYSPFNHMTWLISHRSCIFILLHTEEYRISKPFKQSTNIYCNRLFHKMGKSDIHRISRIYNE